MFRMQLSKNKNNFKHKLHNLFCLDAFKICLILIPVFFMMFVFNQLTPMFADDYTYLNSFETGERITSILQIFPSMYRHYFSMNGRLVTHFIAQLLLSFGTFTTDLLNSLSFIILGLLIYYHVYLSKKNIRLLSLILIYFCLFMFTPAFGQSYLWTTGAANYMYGPLIFLLYLLPFRKTLSSTNKSYRVLFSLLSSVGMLFLGLLVGGINENNAVTAVAITFIYIIYRLIKYKKIYIWSLCAFIASLISTLLNLLSPGTMKRLGDSTLDFFPVKGIVIQIWYILSEFYAIIIAIAVFLSIILVNYLKKTKRNKGDNNNKLKGKISLFIDHYIVEIFYFIIFCCSYFSLSLSGAPKRTLSSCLCYLTILLILIYERADLNKNKYKVVKCVVSLTLSLVFIGSFFQNYLSLHFVYEQYKQRVIIIEQAQVTGDKTPTLPSVYSDNKYSCFDTYGDLREDKDSWQNKVIAHYYGFDYVLLDEEYEHKYMFELV